MSHRTDEILAAIDRGLDDHWYLTRRGTTAHYDTGYGVAYCGIGHIVYRRKYQPGDQRCERCVAKLENRGAPA